MKSPVRSQSCQESWPWPLSVPCWCWVFTGRHTAARIPEQRFPGQRSKNKAMTIYRFTAIAAQQIGLYGLLAVALVSCSLPYQAPVTEASERRVITPPVIVDSGSNQPRMPSTVDRSRSVTTSTSTNPSRQSTRSGTHRVRPGETLYSIAFQHHLDFRSLAIVNDLDPPYSDFR